MERLDVMIYTLFAADESVATFLRQSCYDSAVDEHRRQPMTPFQERLARMTVQVMAGMNVVAFRLSEGQVGGTVPSGAPICLLTTTGRSTGRLRTVPLLFLWRDDDMVAVASNGGMSVAPQWYLNLLVEPQVEVSVRNWRQRRRARTASDEERGQLWPRFVAAYRHFQSYQVRTDRPIPLVVFEPAGERRPARQVG
jgi:deazaflavin-dependent oxidoreductase (nitroreductase family)